MTMTPTTSTTKKTERSADRSLETSGLTVRPRRLRRSEGIRSLVRETVVRPEDLIYPLFAVPDGRPKVEIGSMPGVWQMRVRDIVETASRAWDHGIRAVLLFGIPEFKDAIGSASFDPSGPVQAATSAIKRSVPGMTVMTDVCLCEYTDHGHCGPIVDRNGIKDVDNDQTVELLVRQAISFAEAGADFVAPSDMMDGRVGAIRRALDARRMTEVGIMAYSAKFASGFYGPFREAAESAPQFGDRRSYQMDPPNAREALREVAMDIAEGADILMVKPALAYLDIIARVKREFGYPTAAYAVSGEYTMIKAAAAKGWVDERAVTMESLLAMRRAGADILITYSARDVARWLKD